MFRKKQTWIILTILFFISLGVAFNLFKTAFPILNIDLKMSRQDAFDKATNLLDIIHIGPSEYNQAATFGSDNAAQNYIELDAGGSKAFIEMCNKPSSELGNAQAATNSIRVVEELFKLP